MTMRLMRCNGCDGKKVDRNGHKCIDCNGIGHFHYGENRSPEAILEELAKTRDILRTDEAESKKAGAMFAVCGRELKAQYHKQLTMCNESVAYWAWRIESLETELELARSGGEVAA